MPYEPTEAEIEALERELQLGPLWLNVAQSEMAAAWILSRFVRREEHERVVARCATCSACTPDATPPNIGYRRCCGSDQDKSHEEWCDNKPDATPKGDGHEHLWISTSWGRPRCEKCGKWATDDGSRDREVVSEAGAAASEPRVSPSAPQSAAPVTSITPESMSLLEHHCSDADFAAIGKLRDESYAAGYSAGRDDAARLNVQQVSHVVELGPTTLRTLVALAFAISGEELMPAHSIPCADALLTRLREKETK